MLIYCSPHNVQACAWEAETGSSLSPKLTRATYIVNPYLKKKKKFWFETGCEETHLGSQEAETADWREIKASKSINQDGITRTSLSFLNFIGFY